jgi:lipopolysaccharide/colanic/teichoic acid biosynthesis glycosyltransferase
MSAGNKRLKRLLDVAVALVALGLLSPLLLAIAAAVLVTMGRPIFFRQRRPGRGGRPFEVFKFRTMRDPTDSGGRPTPDMTRVTRLGRLLRSTSLDELPELFNVLRGEMSLVGPRPLLMQYLDRYTPQQARRHEVRPGITGWAQVNGRNAISWEEKFRLDVWYVDHASLWLDVKIVFRTVLMVLRREGVNAESGVTMQEFMGSPPEAAARWKTTASGDEERVVRGVGVPPSGGRGRENRRACPAEAGTPTKNTVARGSFR